MNPTEMLRVAAVARITGRSRASIYQDRKAGLITRQVNVGAKSVAWPANEVQQIVLARIAGLTDEQIRALVGRLHSDREKLASAILAPAPPFSGGPAA